MTCRQAYKFKIFNEKLNSSRWNKEKILFSGFLNFCNAVKVNRLWEIVKLQKNGAENWMELFS